MIKFSVFFFFRLNAVNGMGNGVLQLSYAVLWIIIVSCLLIRSNQQLYCRNCTRVQRASSNGFATEYVISCHSFISANLTVIISVVRKFFSTLYFFFFSPCLKFLFSSFFFFFLLLKSVQA